MRRVAARGTALSARLADPLALAGRTAPSRVVFGPHETNLGRGRALSDRHVAYYARRAAGGAGIVVPETASVHPSDWPYEPAPLASECGPGWADVVGACRPFGTLVLAGLGHTGGQGSSAWSQAALWAPSGVPDVATREMPAEMERSEIEAVVAGFAAAARLAVAVDADGVEVDAGARSLLRQFASGLTNRRTDGHGVDRLRLLREVLGAVRAELGAGRVLALRLSCDEGAAWAGITPSAALDHVRELAPLVDLLTVVRGSAYADDRPDGHTPAGFNTGLAAAVRTVAGRTPVVLQGSVVDVVAAQAALDDGVADAVEMTRAQIADADLVRKVRAGQTVRPCILCNQACRVRDVRNPRVSCVVDPDSGHETELPAGLSVQKVPGDEVVVVGAGPAGLEAARVLAAGGRRVRVLERAERPGGLLSLVAALPGRERFGTFLGWLLAECDRLGVRIETGVEVEVAQVPHRQPGALPTPSGQSTGSREAPFVVATGGRPRPPEFEVGDGACVVTAAEVLSGAGLPGGPVVVHDPIGGPTGVGLAELLAGAGRDVAVVTPDRVPGTRLGTDLADANGRLLRAGVRRETDSELRAVDHQSALVRNRWTGAERRVPCAVLIDCSPPLPGGGTVGDALAPRTVLEAVLDGRRMARELLQ